MTPLQDEVWQHGSVYSILSHPVSINEKGRSGTLQRMYVCACPCLCVSAYGCVRLRVPVYIVYLWGAPRRSVEQWSVCRLLGQFITQDALGEQQMRCTWVLAARWPDTTTSEDTMTPSICHCGHRCPLASPGRAR